MTKGGKERGEKVQGRGGAGREEKGRGRDKERQGGARTGDGKEGEM